MANFATIDKVYSDGVTLILDGSTTPSKKHYPCNRSIVFREGDRVRVIEDSGSLVVEYPIGAPITALAADTAASAIAATNAENVTLKLNNVLLTNIFETGLLTAKKATGLVDQSNASRTIQLRFNGTKYQAKHSSTSTWTDLT